MPWLWTDNNERPNTAVGGITPSLQLALAAWLHFWRPRKAGGITMGTSSLNQVQDRLGVHQTEASPRQGSRARGT
jgi:hypothetical protein